MRRLIRGPVLAASLAATFPAACQLPSAATVPPSPWIAEVAAVRTQAPTALPRQLPPDFAGITAGTAYGLPLVSFHATGQPAVTLCTGEPESCRKAIEPREELGAEVADGVPVLVMVENTEGPGPAIGDETRAFWTTVALTTGEPGWLPRP